MPKVWSSVCWRWSWANVVIMGKILQDSIKDAGRQIMEKYPDKITTDFESNKQFLNQYTEIYGHKLRNRLAGYLVTLKKNEKRIITPPKKEKKRQGNREFRKKQNRKWV